MNFNRKKKKGFTVVELVIVIAVIGVLAAILIPTFVGLVEKAHVAADNTLVRELNNALALDLADKGETKHENMTYALEATEKYGFNVARIDAKASKNKILWDSEHGVFCYLKDNKVEYVPNSIKPGDELDSDDYRLWIIANDVDATYSTYLYKATKTEFETSKGFDAGNEEVTSVTYKHTSGTAQNVVIRTNSAGTTLTINGYVDPNDSTKGDTVKHYDAVGSLVINSVASASYHEYGKVAFAEISKGRIVLEQKSEVEHIHVNAKENPASNENAFAEVIIAKEASVEMPDLSRDDVEIAAGGTLVVVLQSGTSEDAEKDYVWLTKQGVYEQITISNNDESAGNVWVNTSNKPEETKTAAKQIANNIGRNASGEISGTVTVGETEYTVTFNETTRELVVTNTTTSEVVDASTVVEETGLTNVEKDAVKAEAVADAKIAEEANTPAFKVNGAYYNSLAEAIEELTDNATADIVLNKNITIKFDTEAYITIKQNQNVTIDLNGYKIDVVATRSGTSAFIKNNGTLTLKDSKAGEHGIGDGKITFLGTDPDTQDVPGYASNLISNYGNIVIKSGQYENQIQAGYASYALDTYGGANVTIDGGKFIQSAQYTYAVRMFTGTTNQTFTINDGIITGGYAFWLQLPSKGVATKADLYINGGEFICNGYAVYFGGSGNTVETRDYSNVTIVINGGTLNRVMFGGVSSAEKGPKVFQINGGTITELALGDNILSNQQYAIHDNGNGTYTIAPANYQVVVELDNWVAASLDDEIKYVDMYSFWGMNATGCVDSENNQCPKYVLTTDDTQYRDVAVTLGQNEDYVSAKYLFDNYLAAGKSYAGKYIYKLDGKIVKTYYFDTEVEADAFIVTNGGTKTSLN